MKTPDRNWIDASFILANHFDVFIVLLLLLFSHLYNCVAKVLGLEEKKEKFE